MRKTLTLAIERCLELIQDAYSAHQEFAKWHEPPLTISQQAELSLKLEKAVEKAAEWLRAILAEAEEED